MTPQEFLRIKAEQDRIIDAARAVISTARDSANRCPLPAKLRPAVPDDIRPGAIIWYPEWAKRAGEGDPAWSLVVEPRHYGDAFRAYVDDMGCRYGLHGAFVEC